MKYIKSSEMKVMVFQHQGTLGVEMKMLITDTVTTVPDTLNSPWESGQLGSVVKMEDISISQDAFDLLDKAPREGGSFAALMVDKNTFGFCGFGMAAFSGEDLCKSRDCDLTMLKTRITEVEIPKGFKDHVESDK